MTSPKGEDHKHQSGERGRQNNILRLTIGAIASYTQGSHAIASYTQGSHTCAMCEIQEDVESV